MNLCNEGATQDFAQQLTAAKQQLRERRRLQIRLEKMLVATKKQLHGLTANRRR